MSVMHLGTDLDTGLPHTERVEEFITRSSICEGPTGVGKSTLWLLPICTAIIEAGLNLVFFDGAQHPFTYHFLQALARAHGRRLRTLFDNNHLRSERHDPFYHLREIGIDMSDVRDAMFRFANVYYSKEYGPNWFGLASLKAAQDAALGIVREKLHVTLPNVTEKLRALARNARDAEQILYSMEIAASHDAISEVDDGRPEFIRWDQVDRNKEIVLVSWDARSAASSFFASCIHQSLVMYAHLQAVLGKPKSLWPIVIEEWVPLCSATTIQSMALDRKEGVSLHLSHQSQAQINLVNEHLREIAYEQCGYEMYFGMGIRSQEHIQTFSKMHEATLKGRTISQLGLAISEREFRDRILELNFLIDLANTRGAGVLIRKREGQFREPVKLLLEHTMSRECYDFLFNLPFPLKPPPPAPQKPALRDASWDARNAAIGTLFEACRRREGGLRSRGT